jgi:F-type H+-transporting ATPase subunit epsilon
VTLHVELVVPEGEIWTGEAQMVIAKTLDGDIGVLTGHSPVLGILAEGSLVRIFADHGAADHGAADHGAADGQPPAGQGGLSAAVSGGFFSVADDRVSVLARQAQLGTEVDRQAVRADLAAEEEAAQSRGDGGEESASVRYFRALLRAAGDEA